LLDLKTASDTLLAQLRREALLLALFGWGDRGAAAGLFPLVAGQPGGTGAAAFRRCATVAIMTAGGGSSRSSTVRLLLVGRGRPNYCLFFQRAG